ETVHPAVAAGLPLPDGERITTALRTFLGTIEQVPPDYAAIRHGGRRQYDLARQGQAFEPRVRTVTVTSIDAVDIRLPYVAFSVRCSKGTYIRSIARDLGTVLGCGAYVHALRRTAIGDLAVDDAVTIADAREALAGGVPA